MTGLALRGDRIGTVSAARLVSILTAAGLSVFPTAAQDSTLQDRALVVTCDAADYLVAAAGTLAALVLDGYVVTVAQFGSDEKESSGLSPAETRWANVAEGKAAAEYLGIEDWVLLDHKSGEIGYVSTTEMRKQLFALIRHIRPKKIFIPDPYVHYQPDWDVNVIGRMAEESWGYSGGSTFAPELERMGLAPYRTPEVYYYPVGRPYRPREGGEQSARIEAVDISQHISAKTTALAMLRTRNRQTALNAWARLKAAGRSASPLEPLSDRAAQDYIRRWVEQLAATVGAGHGFKYAEEFNYVGPGEIIPPHAMERAVAKRPQP